MALNDYYIAFKNDDYKSVDNFLSAYPAHISYQSGKNYDTPLHRAAYFNYKKVTKCLLNHGADVNRTDIHVRIPLHNAATLGNLEITSMLLNSKSDMYRKDNNGNTPIYVAIFNGKSTIIECLLKYGLSANYNDNGYSLLQEAAILIQPDIINILIENGAKVNELNKTGNNRTALEYACEQMVKNYSWKMSEKDKMRYEKSNDIVSVLISNGADPNVGKNTVYIPIMCAIQVDDFSLVKKLIDCGAKVNVKSKLGLTAVVLAEMGKNKRIIELINKYQNK
jgi:ankyrin repeat protein